MVMVVIAASIVITLFVQLGETLNYTGYWCRYQYHYTAMTWTSAREVCESTHKTLLIIDSMSEMTNISDTIIPHVNQISPATATIGSTVWIGLHQEINPVRLLWDDCDEYTVDPNQWSMATGSSEGCVFFNVTDNTYSIDNCSISMSFICEDLTEAVSDCYTNISVDTQPPGIGTDGSTDGASSFEDCAKLCYSDPQCAAFQAKDNGANYDCHRHYYDLFSAGLAIARAPAEIYVKNVFVYNDPAPNNVPAISNYYCPTSSISPSSTAEYSSDTSSTVIFSSDIASSVLSSADYIASSSNLVVTSTYVVGGTTSSNCYCPCTLALSSSTITSAELQAKIEKIQTELTVDRKETSSYKRKLTSAPDSRVSAQSIGYVGVVILTIVIGLLVFIDIPTIVTDTKRLFKTFCSSCKK